MPFTRQSLEKKLEDHDENIDLLSGAVKQLEEDRDASAKELSRKLKQMQSRVFNGDPNYRGCFRDEEQARAFALVVLSHAGNGSARKKLERDFPDVTRDLDSVSDGGLIPTEFSTRLQALFESYGVFERNAQRMPMRSDSLVFPRQLTDPPVFQIKEGASASESALTTGAVELNCIKFGVLIRVPLELIEDALAVVGEMIATSIARAMARKIDEIGFNGDGSSDYFGITGVRQRLLGLSSTIGNIAGIVVGSGNAYDELTLGDFESLAGALPQYASPDAKWYVSRQVYFGTMVRLALASGGVTAEEIEGRRRLSFMGYPVEITQVMPRVAANGQVCALLGDLRQAATVGDRRMMELRTSDDVYFTQGQRAFLATARKAINVHDVGNASSTASERQAGPIVGLALASS